jgi:hypothetical protein
VSGRLHSEFVLLLFLQAHRETDRFLQRQEFSLRNLAVVKFHYRRPAFSSQLKSEVVNILVKAATLWITLSLGVPVPHSTQCM